MPGIILLVNDSSGFWSGASGLADIANKTPMEVCHVSKVASLTKLFMGVLTMKLSDEGYFKLDDPIKSHINPGLLEGIENAKKVTIRNLLNHTSGIYDLITDQEFYLSILNNPPRNWEPHELLEFVRKKEAYFEPGTTVGYSNTNYLLLSLVHEDATGKSHEDLLEEKILTPLDLSDTYYHKHDALPDVTVQGYFDLYNDGSLMNLSNYNTGNGNGYNGIYSTVEDLYVFIDELLTHKTLLKKELLDTMMTFTTEEEDNKNYGLGIYQDFLDRGVGNYGYGHRGRDLAYSADLFYFTEKDVGFALIVNYGTDAESELKEKYSDLREKIADKLLN